MMFRSFVTHVVSGSVQRRHDLDAAPQRREHLKHFPDLRSGLAGFEFDEESEAHAGGRRELGLAEALVEPCATDDGAEFSR